MDTRNLFIKQPSKKLENCYAGKYQVKMIISNLSTKLDLFSNLHIHLVSHVNFFKSTAIQNPYLSHIQLPSLLIKVNRETKYKLTTIVDSYCLRRTKKL